jgi:hypothetical protein
MLASDHPIFDNPLWERQKHLTSSLQNYLLTSPIVKGSTKDAAITGA